MTKPCTLLCKDVIERHIQSNMHKEALDHEALNRRPLLSVLKIVYTLAKQEIPLMTKYVPVLEVAISLDCDYLKELGVGAKLEVGLEPMLDTGAMLSSGSF